MMIETKLENELISCSAYSNLLAISATSNALYDAFVVVAVVVAVVACAQNNFPDFLIF